MWAGLKEQRIDRNDAANGEETRTCDRTRMPELCDCGCAQALHAAAFRTGATTGDKGSLTLTTLFPCRSSETIVPSAPSTRVSSATISAPSLLPDPPFVVQIRGEVMVRINATPFSRRASM